MYRCDRNKKPSRFKENDMITKLYDSHAWIRYTRILWLMMMLIPFLSCGTYELESGRRDREIVIDGKTPDWHGQLLYDEEDQISLGLMNDDTDLYICVLIEHPMLQRQVMTQGLTLWFDREGGTQKIFGIRYPLGMRPSTEREGGEMTESQGRPRSVSPSEMRNPTQENADLGRAQERFKQSGGYLELLFPKQDEKRRMPSDEAGGIRAVAEASSGMLVCEFKVPLRSGDGSSYGIEVDAGSRIGIGWEVPKPERGYFSQRRAPGAGSGMGGRGGMGGNPGMGGGMRPGMRPQTADGLNLWAHVQLAASDGGS